MTAARTHRRDGELDLAACAGDDGWLWERGRSGLAGRGAAMRVPFGEVGATLAGLAAGGVDDVGLPGCGPVAFLALPFDRDRWADTTAVIPQTVWGRADDGTRWVTRVGGDGATPTPQPAPPPTPPSTTYTVSSARPAAWWCDLVSRATKDIAGGGLHKVVLAREVDVTSDGPIPTGPVVSRLRASYPGCIVFSVDGFVGASPELLVARTGDLVRAHPMAGTAPRGGDPTTDARLAASLLASVKDRQEHQVTIDMVHDTLLPWCSYLDYEAEPSVVAVANVQHLATLVEGRLSTPPPSVLEMVAALHPTPAVGGWPIAEALEWITAYEQLDRRRYAGPVGWVDARGNGAFAVGVRCAELEGPTGRLYAGGGILVDSDPAAELAETQVKLQALLAAIIRP